MKYIVVAKTQLNKYLDCGDGLSSIETLADVHKAIKVLSEEWENEDYVVFGPVLVVRGPRDSASTEALLTDVDTLDYIEPVVKKKKKQPAKTKKS